MLKLLKHDIKDSYLEVVVLNGILIGLSLIVALGILAQSNFLMSIGMVAWSIVLAASFFIVFKTIIQSFNSKLFTNEGYLTLTTPMPIDFILLSKIIINMLWLIVTVVSIATSIIIVVSMVVNGVLDADFFIFDELFRLFWEHPLETFKGVVAGLAGALNLITTLIFELVLTNTDRFKKYKMLKGILIYIAIAIIVSYINIPNSYIGNLLITLGLSAAFYFASRWLITNKLELE